MASPCIVQFCENMGNHRLPNDETRRKLWLKAVLHIKPELTTRKNSFICSAHFKPADFYNIQSLYPGGENLRRNLKRNAVPSVFPWNQVEQEESLTFDPSKVLTTYSKIPPIAFVEMPVLPTETKMEKNDPLLPSRMENILCQSSQSTFQEISIQTTDSAIHSLIPDEVVNIVEVETDSQVLPIEITVESKERCTTNISTSTQTTTNKWSLCIHDIKENANRIHFYTGLENFDKLLFVFYSLGKGAYNLKFFYGPPPPHMDALEQFFITLIILRRHTSYEEISMLYNITIKNVYSIFITWIRFMSLQWRSIDLWIDKENVKEYAPFDFYDKFPATRVILDATECPIKKPKLPLAQQITFSSYKNKNTIKFIIGITPGGLISYISPSYGGSATDRQIIERSNILQQFDYNDEIMVDKGLNVQDIFISFGVKVNMPAFFKKGNQIGPDTLSSNRKVASKRVHVERVIGIMKTYKILTSPLNQTEILLSSDIIYVIAMLVNFRSEIINKNT